MRGWLGGVMAFLLSLGVTAGVVAEPAGCSAVPNVKCLVAEIFSLAKTLPADDGFRRHVSFAEQELAPGDVKVALEYVIEDNPDPSPWEGIKWMARAGRFEAAMKEARQRTSPVERLGGLLEVAERMLDKNDTARARKIIEDVERQLPSIPRDDNDLFAGWIPDQVGELWARLGQPERAVRLISGSGIGSVSKLLAVAREYPAAASLREQAWREAERANESYGWQLLMEDAIGRGDQAEASRIAQYASNAIKGDQADSARISLARVVLSAGLPDLSAKLIEPWPQWVKGKDGIQHSNTVEPLIPVLVGLGRDRDVQTAIGALSNPFHRCRQLNKAADEYFRLGRSDVVAKLDAEALAVAVASPTREPNQRWEHDAALNNLALARGGRGDMDGALIAAAKLLDEAKIREVLSYIVRNAIDSGYGPVAGPAIETLEQRAIAAQDARLLVYAANAWNVTGSETNARNTLFQAMELVEAGQAPLEGNDLGLAAELAWRIEGRGKAESMIGIVDKMGFNDPSAIDHLVEVMRPISPAVAVQLAGRQGEVVRRVTELASIAIQIAEKAK
jgi:hypothetical protein